MVHGRVVQHCDKIPSICMQLPHMPAGIRCRTLPLMQPAYLYPVEVRDVWKKNLDDELSNISGLLQHYPGVCIDAEFPGTVYDAAMPRYMRTPHHNYAVVKQNVDELKLLQLGVALFGPGGVFPVVWQFNFRGFDEKKDRNAPDSIAMLKAHGMDFRKLSKHGVDAGAFAAKFSRAVLGRRPLTWAAFSGSYDFAYLLRVLDGGGPLPETLEGFLAVVLERFGPSVLDVKYIARFCGIRGGLEQVAAALGVERAAGRAHNAGSDSLLTADVLLQMLYRFFGHRDIGALAGAIEGLAY